MNRLLTTFFLLFLVFTTYAQEKLVYHTREGDPMRDKSGCVYWTSSHLQITEYNDGRIQVIMKKPEHIFINNTKTKVGFYKNGELLYLSENWFITVNEGSTLASLRYGYTKDNNEYSTPIAEDNDPYRIKIDKYKGYVLPSHILSFLKDGGVIRITTILYGGTFFDTSVKF